MMKRLISAATVFPSGAQFQQTELNLVRAKVLRGFTALKQLHFDNEFEAVRSRQFDLDRGHTNNKQVHSVHRSAISSLSRLIALRISFLVRGTSPSFHR